jgi:hypothetical protein
MVYLIHDVLSAKMGGAGFVSLLPRPRDNLADGSSWTACDRHKGCCGVWCSGEWIWSFSSLGDNESALNSLDTDLINVRNPRAG